MKKIISLSVIFIFVLSTSIFAGAFDLGLSMLGIDPNKVVGWTNDEIFFEDPYGRIDNISMDVEAFEEGDTWKSFYENTYYVATKTQLARVSEYLDFDCYARLIGGRLFMYEGTKKVGVERLLRECFFVGNGIIPKESIVIDGDPELEKAE